MMRDAAKDADRQSHKSGLQSAAYQHSRASSVSNTTELLRRKAHKEKMLELNKTLREVQQLTQVQKYYDRETSPLAKDPANFETRLPN